MIKTIKEIETRNSSKTYFYNENNILVAIEKDGEITEVYELTKDERAEIEKMI